VETSKKMNSQYKLLKNSALDSTLQNAGEIKTLLELLNELEAEIHPVDFKDELLAITQLFFDSMVESEKGNWEEQEKVFSTLVEAGKTAVGSYYQSGEIDLDKVKELVLTHVDCLIGQYFLNDRRSKVRWVTDGGSNLDFGSTLQKTYREKTISEEGKGVFWALRRARERKIPGVDMVVAVASGGFEPAYLAMNILGVDEFLPIRYSHVSRHDLGVKTPALAPENYAAAIKGKSVLLVDDVILSGRSILQCMDYALQHDPKGLYISSMMGGNSKLTEIYSFKRLTECQPHVWRQVKE